MSTRSGFLHCPMNLELGRPEEEEAITTSLRVFSSISASSLVLSSSFSGAFYQEALAHVNRQESVTVCTYLLNKVDFAIVFVKAGSNKFVVLQAGTVAKAHCLESWPDGVEVGDELLRCIGAGISHDHS